LADEHLERSLRTARAQVAAGVAGDCEECGYDMPRLVEGRCGFCRDGRPNPGPRS
jgi:hypothetical protein